MKIDTFSFRFGDTSGFMEWYRYDPARGLCIDKFDGKMKKVQCEMTEAELDELEKVIRENKIDTWNGFCKLDMCMCSGNSWTLHVTYKDSNDEYIHAMGHSEGPEGFEIGKQALEAYFEKFLQK